MSPADAAPAAPEVVDGGSTVTVDGAPVPDSGPAADGGSAVPDGGLTVRAGGAPAAEPDARWALLDRRDFLRRSLDDADREHEAGDLADADYALLRRRDEGRLVAVEAQLAAADALSARHPGAVSVEPLAAGRIARTGGRGARRRPGRRPRRRTWFAVVGTVALIAGAVVLVADLTSARLPGQVATGDVQLTGAKQIDQELDQAAVLVGEGDVVEALQLYQEVLAKSPHQSTALAEAGWLEWETGSETGTGSLESKGRASVVEAVRVAPGFYAGHLYLGTIDLRQGDDPAAVAQYRLYLADHPPATWTRAYATDIREAFSKTGQPIPAELPAK